MQLSKMFWDIENELEIVHQESKIFDKRGLTILVSCHEDCQ